MKFDSGRSVNQDQARELISPGRNKLGAILQFDFVQPPIIYEISMGVGFLRFVACRPPLSRGNFPGVTGRPA